MSTCKPAVNGVPKAASRSAPVTFEPRSHGGAPASKCRLSPLIGRFCFESSVRRPELVQEGSGRQEVASGETFGKATNDGSYDFNRLLGSASSGP